MMFNISEMAQDRDTVTMEDEWKLIFEFE